MVIAMVEDITPVRESEERFRFVANAAPVTIWMAGPDKRCTYVNRPWLDLTGRDIDDQLGNGWAESIHPDDREQCLEIYNSSSDRREPFTMEYRLRRHDGEYRWMLASGVPRFDPTGSFDGYIGSAVDVTDLRKPKKRCILLAVGSSMRRSRSVVTSPENCTTTSARNWR